MFKKIEVIKFTLQAANNTIKVIDIFNRQLAQYK